MYCIYFVVKMLSFYRHKVCMLLSWYSDTVIRLGIILECPFAYFPLILFILLGLVMGLCLHPVQQKMTSCHRTKWINDDTLLIHREIFSLYRIQWSFVEDKVRSPRVKTKTPYFIFAKFFFFAKWMKNMLWKQQLFTKKKKTFHNLCVCEIFPLSRQGRRKHYTHLSSNQINNNF
jgi:hypothetical protein